MADYLDRTIDHRYRSFRTITVQLPIHKICSYDQSSGHSSKMALENLQKAINPSRAWRLLRPFNSIKTIESGRQCDFLGMTPLHTLAISNSNNNNNTKYDIELYKLLIKQYPENLVTLDKCGGLPILYAFWTDAPQEIIQLFIEQHQTLFSNHEMNWPGMIETIGRAHYLPGRGASAALKCIKNVLHTHQVAFPHHCVDWENVVTEWAKEDTSRTTERNVQKFHRDAFKYLISFSISERVKALGVEKWRKQIQDHVNELNWFLCYRKKSTELIYSKLARYEQLGQLREATSLLELALWKSSIDQDTDGECCRDKAKVDVCHIRCGADVVVPNVLSFLLPA